MHAVIQRYVRTAPTTDEVVAAGRRLSGMRDRVPGFVSCVILRAGPGRLTMVSLFEDEETSALLRTLYPLVLGVGGWFLGELVVMTAIPGVPLDDEPLVVLSMSLPIGLGIYFAGIRRGASVSTRIVGLVAAIGGALVGGWLGFNATAGFVAIATTLVGAALGANLSVILLDIARDRSVHDRFVETNAKTTLNARSEISAKGAWS